MDVKSDCLLICLIVHCLIYHSEAASNDEREKPVRKNNNRWTKKEMADLVFFDVITDTGVPRHFDRIKKMWYTKYPGSNKTEGALQQKIRFLRKEWQQEEEYRAYFKWNESLDKELLDLYFNIRRHGRDSKKSLIGEWKRRHPDYRAGKHSLQVRVGRILEEKKYSDYVPKGFTEASSQVQHLLRDSKARHYWTKDEKAAFIHIYKLTDTGEPGQFNRIKLMWRKKFLKSELTDMALLYMFHKIRRSSRKKAEHKGHHNWDAGTSEMTESGGFPLTELGEGSKAESSKSRSGKQTKSLPRMKSVEELLWGRGEAEREKRSGKAPMVYPSDESTSSSPTMMSEDSE